MALARRAGDILSRFPRHWEADGAGKVFGLVVRELARNLEILSAHTGRVRHAHRIDDAGEVRDLLLIAGLHGFGPAHFALGSRRRAALMSVASVLNDPQADDPEAAPSEFTPEDRETERKRLGDLLALRDAVLEPVPEEPDPDVQYHDRLAGAIQELTGLEPELAAMRRRLHRLIRTHRAGNGTVAAILHAAAAYLGLEPGPVESEADDYFHFCLAMETLRIALVEDAGAGLPDYEFPPFEEYLVLEENPFISAEVEPVERVYGERFTVDRNGFDEVTVSVHVAGIGERTVGPMVVNIQTGDGVWYRGSVPDGSELVFGADGKAFLDEADVTGHAWSFHGGVFADADALDAAHDFRFGDETLPAEEPAEKTATFAETKPVPGGFGFDAALPHGPGSLQNPTLSVGTTRWRFFVQAAHFGTRKGDPPQDLPALALYNAALFDGSVFQHKAPPEPSGKVGFSWREREAFSMILWIPERFAALDAEGVPKVTDHLKGLLDRHRAAGVKLDVRYASDLWTLPEGILRDPGEGGLGVAIRGTRLWPGEEPPPET